MLGLKALPQTAGDASVQSGGTDVLLAGQPGVAHVLQLDNGRLIVGFEDERKADWADAAFLIDGASLAAAVPEPASLGLLLAGLGAGALWMRRRMT